MPNFIMKLKLRRYGWKEQFRYKLSNGGVTIVYKNKSNDIAEISYCSGFVKMILLQKDQKDNERLLKYPYKELKENNHGRKRKI